MISVYRVYFSLRSTRYALVLANNQPQALIVARTDGHPIKKTGYAVRATKEVTRA